MSEIEEQWLDSLDRSANSGFYNFEIQKDELSKLVALARQGLQLAEVKGNVDMRTLDRPALEKVCWKKDAQVTALKAELTTLKQTNAELAQWKAEQQQALITMGATVLNAGFKGDSLVNGIKWLVCELESAQKQNTELVKDKERLDWLDDVLQQGDIEIYSRLNLDSDCVDLRDALDAAMAKEKA